MNAFLYRALAASGAAAALAASSSTALADDGYAMPPPPEAAPSPPVVAPPPPGARAGRARVIIAQPQPPRDVATFTETSPNGALIGSGAVMFGLSYGGSLIVAATSDRPSDQHLFIPVAGPWIDLTNRDAGLDEGRFRPPLSDVNETANKIMLVTSGLFQAAGVAQIIGGFMFPETRTVTRTLGVHVTPTGGAGMVGLAAYGSF